MTVLAEIVSVDPFGDRLRPGPGAGTVVLVAFLVSYLAIRTSARLTRSVSWWPGGVETEGGVHLHHLVWGILLMLFCGFLSFAAPLHSPWWHFIAIGFGIGAGFTLDEFALWVHLEDVYWSEAGRMSFDAVVCTFAFAVLVVLGTRPFGLDEPASIWGTAAAVTVILALALVCFAKGRVLLGVIGVFIPVVAFFGAVRLAHPALHLGEAPLRRRPHGQGARALRPGPADDARRAAARRSHRRAPDRRDRDTQGALMRIAAALFVCACALILAAPAAQAQTTPCPPRARRRSTCSRRTRSAPTPSRPARTGSRCSTRRG